VLTRGLVGTALLLLVGALATTGGLHRDRLPGWYRQVCAEVTSC
jgi:hypothetical protein